MIQLALLGQSDIVQRSVYVGNIRAMFCDNSDGSYDVVLEVNSQKFLIRVSRFFEQIVEFEILAVKGFVELSKKMIQVIRSLVDHLFCRLD